MVVGVGRGVRGDGHHRPVWITRGGARRGVDLVVVGVGRGVRGDGHHRPVWWCTIRGGSSGGGAGCEG